MKRQRLIWSLTGISTVLGFALTVQLASRSSDNAMPTTSYIDLRTQIAEQAQEHQVLEHAISKQAVQLAEFQAASGSTESLQKALENDESSVAEQAGTMPVTGQGITVSIKDDPLLPGDPQYIGTFGTESDQWISMIVNDLFANGATAIGINGQRLVTTSSIRLVSHNGIGGVQVNLHPIVEPYVITAVGNISDMTAALTVNQIVTYLNIMYEDCIIKSYPAENGVMVPAYSGPLPGTWAKEVSN